jgi:hypothetical protein
MATTSAARRAAPAADPARHRRGWDVLLGRTPPGGGELLLVTGGLALVAAAAFGAHVRPGGFYNDDWTYLSNARYPPDDTFAGAVRNLDWLSFRPLQMLYWPFAFRIIGTDPSVHAVWLLAIGVLMAGLVFLLLRTLRFAPLDAALLAALALLLPVADSTRFWPALGANVLAVALYLAGVVVAVHGLRADGRRAWALHAAAVALYASSILLYEIAASLILATGLLYVALAGRRGLGPWAIDVLVAAALLLLVTSGTFYDPLPPGDMAGHAGKIARQVPWVLTETLWAPATASPAARLVTLLVAVSVLLAGRLVAGRPGDPDFTRALRWWLRVALGAALATAVAYLMIVPSDQLDPRSAGQGNRGNILAGMGVAVFAYAVIATAALLATRRMRAWRRAGAVATGLAAVLVAVGAFTQVRSDQRLWEAAAREQGRIVGLIGRTTPRPRDGTTFLTFGAPITTAPGVPVFQAPWDLAGAVRLHYDHPSLRAYPVPPASRVDCGAGSLTLHNYNDAFERQTARYPAVRLVDVPGGRALSVRDRAECAALTGRLLR